MSAQKEAGKLPKLILDISLMAKRRSARKLLLTLELVEKLGPEKLYCSNEFVGKIKELYTWYRELEPEIAPKLKRSLDHLQEKIIPFFKLEIEPSEVLTKKIEELSRHISPGFAIANGVCSEELILASHLGAPVLAATRGFEFKILPLTRESLSVNLTPERKSVHIGNPARGIKIVILTLVGVTETVVRILKKRDETFDRDFNRSIEMIANTFGKSKEDLKDFYDFAARAALPIAVLFDPFQRQTFAIR